MVTKGYDSSLATLLDRCRTEDENMEYQQKILLAVIVVLVVFALYIVFTTMPAAPTAPAKPPNITAAESILHKAVLFGKGQKTYSYSFSDISNGYNTTYTLLDQGAEREAIVQNPISTKEIYYLENGTILCITYGDEQEVLLYLWECGRGELSRIDKHQLFQ